MWWLCTRFPLLMLDSIGQRENNEPTAIVERQIILQVNKAAAELGIQAGQPVSSALNLYPELNIAERQILSEQQLLEQAALWAYRFSPQVAIDSESATVFVELRGSLRLFKGFNRLYQYFSGGLEKRRLHYYCGLAHSPSAAHLISYGSNRPKFYRYSATKLDNYKIQQQLQALPVSLLSCEKETRNTLQSMGIQRLQALFELPEQALGKRFGAQFCQLIRYLKGTEVELRTLFYPPEKFFSRRYFSAALNNKQQLHIPILELLKELKHYLRLRQRINRNLQWQLYYIDGKTQQLPLASSHHFFQQQALFDLTVLKLDQFTLLANVEALSLQCDDFEKTNIKNISLFQQQEDMSWGKTEDSDEEYAIVLDKLLSRISRDNCYRIDTKDKHLPEQSWSKLTVTERGSSHSADRKTPAKTSLDDAAPRRPLWLLPEPAAIQQHRRKLYWHGQLQLLQGPERIDSQWWQQRQIRDYFIASHESGAVYWIFKDQINRRWFVHGLFA